VRSRENLDPPLTRGHHHPNLLLIKNYIKEKSLGFVKKEVWA
jgi:hypothetical protein